MVKLNSTTPHKVASIVRVNSDHIESTAWDNWNNPLLRTNEQVYTSVIITLHRVSIRLYLYCVEYKSISSYYESYIGQKLDRRLFVRTVYEQI